jgi:cobalt transporter subunit CbtB
MLAKETNPSEGRDRRYDMTTKTLTAAAISTETLSIGAVALLGALMIWVAGFANAATIHDVAHDQRHAIAFPCH